MSRDALICNRRGAVNEVTALGSHHDQVKLNGCWRLSALGNAALKRYALAQRVCKVNADRCAASRKNQFNATALDDTSICTYVCHAANIYHKHLCYCCWRV